MTITSDMRYGRQGGRFTTQTRAADALDEIRRYRETQAAERDAAEDGSEQLDLFGADT